MLPIWLLAAMMIMMYYWRFWEPWEVQCLVLRLSMLLLSFFSQGSVGTFPECVARVPVSHGGLGAEGVFARRCVLFATVRNRPQPFRNRSQPSAAVRAIPIWPCRPMVSSAGVIVFGGFKRLVASFRVAGVAVLTWHSDVFCNVAFCVAGAILLWRFQKMRCSFRGRRSTLDVSIIIFRGRRNTFDVSCCVFFANRIGRAASSGDTVQFPWQAWLFLRCDENWRKPRTNHRFWGSKFRGPTKTPRKTSILKLQSVKISGRLARNARFSAPTCLVSSFVVFLWRRRGLCGSCKTSPFRRFPSRLSCCFAWQAWHFATFPTCLITCRKCQNWRMSRAKSLVFLWRRRVYGEAAKPLLFEGFQAGCHVVLRGRRGTLWHSNLFDNVSKMSKLEDVSHEMLVFLHPLVSSRVLWFSCGVAVSMGEAAKPLLFEGFQAGCYVVLHGRRGTLWHSNLFDDVSKMSKKEDVSHEMLVFLHPLVSCRVSGFPVASPCLGGKLQNLSFSKVSKQVVMLFCVAGGSLCDIPTCLIMCRKCQNWRSLAGNAVFLHPLLCGKLRTPQSTLYTLHSTLHNLHFTLYTFTLHTLHFTLYTPHSTLYILHSTLYTPHSTLSTQHSTLHSYWAQKSFKTNNFT